MDEGEWKVEWKTDDLYTIVMKIYMYVNFVLLNWKYVHKVFTIPLPNFQSLFKVSLLFFSSRPLVSLLKEKSKICPKLIELLSWNGPTVHVCCFMLARASAKTFVSRVQKTVKKKKFLLAEKFVTSVFRQPRYHCISWHNNFKEKDYALNGGRHFLNLICS